MGFRGSPEPPGDSEEHTFRTNDAHIQNYGQNTSDESDIEEGDGNNIYEGYEPLPITDNSTGVAGLEEENMEDMEYDSNEAPTNPDLPNIVSSDIELEREVWSQPRPQELEIVLDSSRTQEIMSAMASITLPTSAIPQWAQGIPEEKWKQDLLDRIRQRKGNSTTNTEVN